MSTDLREGAGVGNEAEKFFSFLLGLTRGGGITISEAWRHLDYKHAEHKGIISGRDDQEPSYKALGFSTFESFLSTLKFKSHNNYDQGYAPC